MGLSKPETIFRSRQKNSTAIITLAVLFPLLQNCGENNFVAKSLSIPSTSTPLALSGVAITDPMSNMALQNSFILKGNCSTSLNVEITGDLASPLSTACDNGKFSATINFSSGDGNKSIMVAQRDALGNVKADSRTFIKDTVAPQVSVLSQLSGAYIKNQVSVSGACENNLDVIVKIGSVQITSPCNSGMYNGTLNIQSIAEGNINLEVAQTDKVGLTTAVMVALKKDTVAPVVSISTPVATSTLTSPPTLTGTCETGPGVTIGGTGVTNSFSTECLNGAFSAKVDLGTGSGSRLVTVSQADAAGNIGNNSRTYQVQISVPAIAIAIVTPAPNAAAANGVTLTGTCQNGLTISITGTGLLANTTTACSNGLFSQAVTFSAGEGNKTITVTQTDTSTTSSGFSTRTFIKDSVAPALTIVTPIANTATKGNVTVFGACENGLPVNIGGVGIASPISSICSNGTYSSVVMTSTGDGTKQISVTQTDAALNATTKNVSVIRDTMNPAITIAGPAAGTAAATGVTVTGACETGLTVTASGADLTSSFASSCVNSAYSVAVLFAGADGTKVVTVSQTDGAGNTGSAQRSFTKSTAPVEIAPNNLHGEALYANKCSVCHGELSVSTRRGMSVAQIQYGLTNIPEMSILKGKITSDEVAIIAWVLGGKASSPAASRTPFACVSSRPPGHSGLRRLTNYELTNSLTDIFGAAVVNQVTSTIANLPADSNVDGFDNMSPNVSPTSITSYEELAAAVGDAFVANASALTNLVGNCSTATTLTDTCVNNFIVKLGKSAVRRDVTTDEKTKLLALYRQTSADSSDKLEGLRMIVAYFLQSVSFLYKVEVGSTLVAGGDGLTFMLTPYEMATRLSYLVWGTGPDATLLAVAADGTLATDSVYQAQLDRLLADPKAKVHFRHFYLQWLKPDKQRPYLYGQGFLNGVDATGLDAALQQEMIDYIDYITWTAKGSYADLLTSDLVFAKTDATAAVYDVAKWNGSSTNVIRAPAGTRSGLLTRAGLLAVGVDQGHPILRGVFMRKKLLCGILPPPIPAAFPVGALDPPIVDGSHSSRQLYTTKTQDAACMRCHAMINPLGFALSGFDSLGRFQTSEKIFSLSGDYLGTQPIDSIATVNVNAPNSTYVTNAAGLAMEMAHGDEGPACLTTKWYQYAVGRVRDDNDGCSMNQVSDGFKSSGGSLVNMIRQTALSPSFRVRKARN